MDVLRRVMRDTRPPTDVRQVYKPAAHLTGQRMDLPVSARWLTELLCTVQDVHLTATERSKKVR
jgi:hypothetical protein